jgi:hypothetical protein
VSLEENFGSRKFRAAASGQPQSPSHPASRAYVLR